MFIEFPETLISLWCPVQVTNQPFLDVFAKYKDSKGRQAKLKAPAELEAFLQAVLQVSYPHKGTIVSQQLLSISNLRSAHILSAILVSALHHGEGLHLDTHT